jgi:uncharacterized protein with von Willebrand factor type A (vWA) domain
MKPLENSPMAGPKSGELFPNLLLFARHLKEKGLKITPGRVIDAARSLAFIDLSKRQDFASALRANWVSSAQEISLFHELFREFWRHWERTERKRLLPSPEGVKAEGEGQENLPFLSQEDLSSQEPEGPGKEGQGLRYSPGERLSTKDFSHIPLPQAPTLEREFQRLLSSWVMKRSLRKRPSLRGRQVDFRRTFRKALGYGGELLQLVRKDSKVKPLKIITLCDVSGSMDTSTRFVLLFFHGLQRAFRRSETFVFSTRLTRITELLKRNRWPAALKAIGERAQDWSGGTRIGQCLRIFNERYAKGLAAGSMIVIFISDGWDRGDPALLESEMRRLKRRARRIIWMNPLLQTPGYQPICLGMRTALPYIDYFIPASSLKSFQELGRTLISRLS